jgi:hypothetical protein
LVLRGPARWRNITTVVLSQPLLKLIVIATISKTVLCDSLTDLLKLYVITTVAKTVSYCELQCCFLKAKNVITTVAKTVFSDGANVIFSAAF